MWFQFSWLFAFLIFLKEMLQVNIPPGQCLIWGKIEICKSVTIGLGLLGSSYCTFKCIRNTPSIHFTGHVRLFAGLNLSQSSLISCAAVGWIWVLRKMSLQRQTGFHQCMKATSLLGKATQKRKAALLGLDVFRRPHCPWQRLQGKTHQLCHCPFPQKYRFEQHNMLGSFLIAVRTHLMGAIQERNGLYWLRMRTQSILEESHATEA